MTELNEAAVRDMLRSVEECYCKQEEFCDQWGCTSIKPLAESWLAQGEALAAAQLPDGVGHWWKGSAHWYDPSSSPMPGCPLCAALASLSDISGAARD